MYKAKDAALHPKSNPHKRFALDEPSLIISAFFRDATRSGEPLSATTVYYYVTGEL